MSKRWLFIGVLLLFLIPTLGLSQSLLYQTSFGLFENPFDAAFDVTDSGLEPNFSTLDRNYIFGGLTNFPELPTNNSFVMVPLELGYYRAGARPWSGLGDILLDTTQSTRSDGKTATSTQTKAVGTTNFTWIDQETDSQYDKLQAWDTDIGGQFLIGLSKFNIGFGASWDYEQNASGAAIDVWADANREDKDTFFFDSAGAGVAPNPVEDYVQTQTFEMPDTDSTVNVWVPAYFKVLGIGVETTLNAGINKRDQSSSIEESFTAPQQAGAGSFNNVVVENSTTDEIGYTSIDLDAICTFGPLLGNHKDNRLELGLNGGIMLNNADTLKNVLIIQDFDFAGSGAPLTPVNNTGITDINTSTKRDGTTGYDVNASGQHFFYWDIVEPLTFGMAPMLEMGITYTPAFSTHNTEQVLIVKNDNDADGDYNDAADTIVSTTTDFKNNDDGGNRDYTVSTTLPSALRFRPSGWPFGITVGNELGVDFTVRRVKDKTDTTEVTVETTDGTGAPISTVVTTAADSFEQKSTTTVWQFSSDFELALNFYLGDHSTLDVVVNQDPIGGAFALFVQGIIAFK
jgi:hypothetical protein